MASELSLAAHAREVIQAMKQDPPRQHACRFSRCGCVAPDRSGRVPLMALPDKHHVCQAAQREKRVLSSRCIPENDVPKPPEPLMPKSCCTLPIEKKSNLGVVLPEAPDSLDPDKENAGRPCENPASPTENELTDSVLSKSQVLLEYLASLKLDFEHEQPVCDDDFQVEVSPSHRSSQASLDVNTQTDLETVQIPVVLMHKITKLLADGHLGHICPSRDELHLKDSSTYEKDGSQGRNAKKEPSECTPSLSTRSSRVSSFSGTDSPGAAEIDSNPSIGTAADCSVEPPKQRPRSLSEASTVAPSKISTPVQAARGGSVTTPCPLQAQPLATPAAIVSHVRHQTLSPRGIRRPVSVSPRYAAPHSPRYVAPHPVACLLAQSTAVSTRVSPTVTVAVCLQSSQSNVVSMTTKIHIGGN